MQHSNAIFLFYNESFMMNSESLDTGYEAEVLFSH